VRVPRSPSIASDQVVGVPFARDWKDQNAVPRGLTVDVGPWELAGSPLSRVKRLLSTSPEGKPTAANWKRVPGGPSFGVTCTPTEKRGGGDWRSAAPTRSSSAAGVRPVALSSALA